MTPQEIADIFAELELRLIRSMKVSLMAGQNPGHRQRKKRLELQRFRQRNEQIMDDVSQDIAREIETLLEDAFDDGVLKTAEEHAATHPGYKLEGAFDGLDTRRLDSLIEDVQQDFRTAETAALRMTDDIYKKIVYRAEIAQASGLLTMEQAVDQAAREFLERGITCIQYADGRRVNIASYAEMALRTASLRSRLRGDAALRKELGVDTVVVSQYGACSDTCLPWQGRVYLDDVWGEQPKETAAGRGLSRNGRWYPLLSVAVDAGLFHPNCRHGLSTWYEGISKLPPLMDATAIRRTAALESHQRELERKVRKYKRLEAGALDPANEKKYRTKRMAAQKELREHIDANSDTLRRYYWREKVHDRPGNITFKSGYKELEPLPKPPQGTQLTPDPKSTEVINKAIRRFSKEFPKVEEIVQYHRYIYDSTNNPAAFVLETDEQGNLSVGVVYNLNIWYNVNVAEDLAKKCAESGLLSNAGTPESIVFHEFGHATFHSALLQEVGYDGVYFNNQQESRYLYLYKQCPNFLYNIAYPDFKGNGDSLKARIRNDLSLRACKNVGEFVAECFSQYYCGNPCAAAKRIVDYYKERL